MPQDFKVTVHWLESSRAQRILVLLEELKIDYDIKTYKRDKDGLAPPELQKIHPLGKSPSVVIEVPGESPLVLAESAVICEYIAEHWSKHLIPTQYVAGKEGAVHGETEAWMRMNYFEHYIEGSLMSLEGIAAVILSKNLLFPLALIAFMTKMIKKYIKNAPVPFFI